MDEPQSRVVRVKIYNREYALRTSGDPERLRALCASLDRRMRDAAATSGTADTLKVAILTALTLAEDLHRVREALREMDASVSRRSQACVSMLDSFLC
jgi:cell division protein ZapA